MKKDETLGIVVGAAAMVGAFLWARKHTKPTEGIGGLSTRELEDRVWGFSSYGRGRIHFYARVNGETREFTNTDTISYDRIQERDDLMDHERGTMGLTYRQALERFYRYAQNEGKEWYPWR